MGWNMGRFGPARVSSSDTLCPCNPGIQSHPLSYRKRITIECLVKCIAVCIAKARSAVPSGGMLVYIISPYGAVYLLHWVQTARSSCSGEENIMWSFEDTRFQYCNALHMCLVGQSYVMPPLLKKICDPREMVCSSTSRNVSVPVEAARQWRGDWWFPV